jgi:hypothetical protein
MKEIINTVINNYYRRLYEVQGMGRYFDQEYITDAMLEDKELIKDINKAVAQLGKPNAK